MRKQRFLEQQAAQEQQQAQQAQLQDTVKQGLGTAVSLYMQKQTEAAQVGAFGEMLKMHGDTLGFGADDIERYSKMPRPQQLQMANMFTGQMGQQVGRMNYLNRSISGYGGGGGGNGGSGGGAFFTMPGGV
jgi:hypothetical protein